jgi:diadenosine tetraphosphate (Ap4A) HIT family hydrolase
MHLGNRMLGLTLQAVKRAAGPFQQGSHHLAYDAMASTACTICDEVAGRTAAPGGAIYDDGLWLVSHHRGPYTDPGELILKARRHVESIADLRADEAAALGPILQAAVAAVARTVQPERVYVASFGERVRHVHFYILPRTAALPAGHVLSDVYKRGRTLLRGLGLVRNPSTTERAAAADRVRQDEAWKRLSI